MKIKIHWVGSRFDGPPTRFWGYLEDLDENVRSRTFYGWDDQIYVFWGSKYRIDFRKRFLDEHFKIQIFSQKTRYVTFNNDIFNNKIIDEFRQHLTLEKLKGQ